MRWFTICSLCSLGWASALGAQAPEAWQVAARTWRSRLDPGRELPNPQMQPTGRGGPGLLAGAALLEARQWKR
jgi:hypothetical protein